MARQVREPAADPRQKIASLEREVASLRRELSAALEQQTATSEILRVIAGSPMELGLILDTIAATATRLCRADIAAVVRRRGGELRYATWHVSDPAIAAGGFPDSELDRGSIPGRAVLDGRSVNVADIRSLPEDEWRAAWRAHRRLGHRSNAAAPLMRGGEAIGAIGVLRLALDPFTDADVAFLETFADQAVIAIENARLFGELQERNRELTEALEQQTATAEVLRVIASSPADLQSVLDTIVESAARLSGCSGSVLWWANGAIRRRLAS